MSRSRSQPVAERSVLAAGYAPLDIVSYAGRVWHSAGGTAGNVAAILGFLGWSSTLAVDYGDDVAGQRVLRDLQAANVSVHLVRKVGGGRTPRVVHEIDGAGHRYRFICSKCGSRFPHSRPLRTDRAADIAASEPRPAVFFFDRVNAGTVLLAEHFAASGTVVVLEPSRPAAARLMVRAIAAADIVKQADDRDAGLESFEPRQGQLRIVTSGAAGTWFRLGVGAWHHSPAFAYPVVDAGGAGDWTTAGLIHAIEPGRRPTVRQVRDGLAWAQALAAVSCGSPGARGLARTQSAEAVVRAAAFVQRREVEPPATTVPSIRRASSPASLCSYCLMPQEAGGRLPGLAIGTQSTSPLADSVPPDRRVAAR
jgi:sugar/nucleoside kinase (ribokinase family)